MRIFPEERELRTAVLDHLEGLDGAATADELRSRIAELPEQQRKRTERWLAALAAARRIDPWVELVFRLLPSPTDDADVTCALCGKTSKEVPRLVASDSAAVCEECVGRAVLQLYGAGWQLPPLPRKAPPPKVLTTLLRRLQRRRRRRPLRAPAALLPPKQPEGPRPCLHGLATCLDCQHVRGWPLAAVKRASLQGKHSLAKLVRRGLL